MKRIFYTIICCFTLLLMPIQVNAAGGVEVNTTSITLEQGTSKTFNIIATNAAAYLKFSNSNSSVATLDNKPDWIESQTTAIKVNGLTVGQSVISITVDAATFDEEVIKKTINVNVNVIPPKSSNNNLKEIKVDEIKVDNFNANTTTYTLMNTDLSTVTINAVADDSKASISGTGTKNLSYGVNTLNIVVTAENGSKKTYTLKITRNDKRSSDNLLSSLSVSVGKIDFDSNKTSYTINVDKDTTEIKIDAKAKSSKAKVTGTGTIKLKEGNNEIKVVVTAENGSNKTYTINVIKKGKDTSASELSSNNNLKSLVVSGYNINFDSNKKIYYLNVDENVTNLNIEAICEDTKAKVEVNNIDNLVKGENVITINVTAENGDVNTYKLLVNKTSSEVSESHNCIYKYLFIIETIIIVLLVAVFGLLYSKKKTKKRK